VPAADIDLLLEAGRRPAGLATCQDSEGSTLSWKSRSGVRSNG
jgi:hypothetical protein